MSWIYSLYFLFSFYICFLYFTFFDQWASPVFTRLRWQMSERYINLVSKPEKALWRSEDNALEIGPGDSFFTMITTTCYASGDRLLICFLLECRQGLKLMKTTIGMQFLSRWERCGDHRRHVLSPKSMKPIITNKGWSSDRRMFPRLSGTNFWSWKQAKN